MEHTLPLRLRAECVYVVIVAMSLALCAAGAGAQTWNLKADWSNTNNPNGVWRYLVDGATGVPGTRDSDPFLAPGAPAVWSDGVTHHVGWSQSIGTEIGLDVLTGDVYAHTGVPQERIEIDWVSPLTGTVTVSGATWKLRDIGRSNYWSILVNGTEVVSGQLVSGDGVDRGHPELFDFTTAVNAGDIVEYSAFTLATGDYLGLDFSLNAVTTTPEPNTIALLGIGFAAFGFRRHHRRRFPRGSRG